MYILKNRKKNSDDLHFKTVETVHEIIYDIKNNGDKSLKFYENKFGGESRDQFKLSDEEIENLISSLDFETKKIIELNVKRIESFAKAQLETINPLEGNFGEGIRMGHKIIPIDSIGAYVPGGRYPLLSSGPMVIVPAKVAGVTNIIACSPANYKGSIHPAVVYGLQLSGATEIYGVGGAQAIAAMAYGTESITKINMIAGPGNRFVAEAKKQVFGVVGIDMIAGPSEVVIISDDTSNPELCAADLLAQSEHDPNSRAILISSSKDIAEEVVLEVEKQIQRFPSDSPVHHSWEDMGEIIITESDEASIHLSNEIAGEHVQVHCKNLRKYENELKNYGSLFLGENSSVVFSDKVSGTNHTLPTNKAGKYTGGLWVGSYLKTQTFQEINEPGLTTLADHSTKQSDIEGLHGHKMSAYKRLEN
ncbi:histidinol dehydrogenase [Staphylococcus equorum]|uniref:histidinol dehydrogenase n=1 Tax=Staphylococcus equorum TaxID=246432 RepID=UPI000D1C3B50|nr:histidinol dehydrogenase [Staphylococcus equorum]PTE79371.1 histidinol dehydrogenase [Staphylococcus equorum]PTE90048.1 histidinol dehydrogenase [Staphylococcus equorum]